MKIKAVIGLFLSLISMTIFAGSPIAIQKYGHVTPAQENLIANAFLYLNKFWADKGKSLSRNTTEKYFTPDTTLIINGKTVYSGYDQFDAHFKTVGKSIIGKIRFPLLEIMSVENKVIVRFDEDIHDNNKKNYPANVIAIFTLKDNKIQKWEEVAYTKYFCQTESEKAVYSH